MKDKKVWVVWKYETRNGKTTKVPYQPSGSHAKSTDPSTWVSYAEAKEASNRFDGVGFCFDGATLGVDLDHVISADGLLPSLQTFIENASTYTEYSPSGTGLHLVFSLSEPLMLKANKHTNVDGTGYECYTSGRFFTYTGKRYNKLARRSIDAQEAESLLAQLGYPWSKAPVVPQRTEPVVTSLDDRTVLDIMFSSRNGAEMRSVYNGDASKYGGDISSADIRLCNTLAFYTGRNKEQVERIWLASPLGQREKTQKRKDYRNRTIDEAIAKCDKVYTQTTASAHTPEWSTIEKELKALLKEMSSADDAQMKDLQTKMKSLKERYLSIFHEKVADTYPYLYYEVGEEKNYWLYNNDTGVYDPVNVSTMRCIIMRLLNDSGTVPSTRWANECMMRFRAIYPDRAKELSDFDATYNSVHVENGWITFNPVSLSPHTPDRLSLCKLPTEYVPEATCRTYDNLFVEWGLPSDASHAIKQFSGYLLSPRVNLQKMLILEGEPGTGKSLLTTVWARMFGKLAAPELSLDKFTENSRFFYTNFVGKRLLWWNETSPKRSHLGSNLQRMIDGYSYLVERKGIGGETEHENTTKSVLTTNGLPDSMDQGMPSRMLYIKFTKVFRGSKEEDTTLLSKLLAERSGILNRMIEGLVDLERENRFITISGQEELLEDHKRTSSRPSEFIDMFFVPDSTQSVFVTNKDLRDAFSVYMNGKPGYFDTPEKFTKEVMRNGLKEYRATMRVERKSVGRGLLGLKLRDGYVWETRGFTGERFIKATHENIPTEYVSNNLISANDINF